MYLELTSSLGWEKIGERRGMSIFKNSEDTPFYSDSEDDHKFKNKCIIKNLFANSFGIVLVLLLNLYLFTLNPDYFITNLDISLFMTFIILLLGEMLFAWIPFVKYKMNIVQTNYHKIEIRSWVFSFIYIGCFSRLPLCLAISQAINSDYILYMTIFWVLWTMLGFIVYFLRYKIKDIFVLCGFLMLIISLFIPIFAVNNSSHQGNGHIDKMLTIFYQDDGTPVFKDGIREHESLLMYFQQVHQENDEKAYEYIYYNFSSEFVRKLWMNNVMKVYFINESDIIEKENIQLVDLEDKNRVMILHNKEILVIRDMEQLTKEDKQMILYQIKWKS